MISVDIEQSRVVYLAEAVLLSEPFISTSPSIRQTTNADLDREGRAKRWLIRLVILSFVLKLIGISIFAVAKHLYHEHHREDEDGSSGPPSNATNTTTNDTAAYLFQPGEEIPTLYPSQVKQRPLELKSIPFRMRERYESLYGILLDQNAVYGPIDEPQDMPVLKALEWLAKDPAILDVETNVLLERFAVVVLYYSTGGPTTWRKQLRFLWMDTSICDWWSRQFDIGIFCDEETQTTVKEIYLVSNNLFGTIPPELALLTNLQSLSLQDNLLFGGIPKDLATLGPSLQQLNLAYNSLSSPIPVELERLDQLTSVFLEGNEITGELDRVFCNSKQEESSPLSEAAADCGGLFPRVLCSCCTVCCDERGDCDDDHSSSRIVSHEKHMAPF